MRNRSLCFGGVFLLAAVIGVTTHRVEPVEQPSIKQSIETEAEMIEIVSVTEPEPEPLCTEEPVEEKAPESRYTDHDKELLLLIAVAEAEGEGVKGQALVMRVVLNRVESGVFPDDISGVIFQRNQFTTADHGGRIWTVKPNEDSYKALELIEDGWDESEGALYFEATKNVPTWHSLNLRKLFTYGGHTFYKERQYEDEIR